MIQHQFWVTVGHTACVILILCAVGLTARVSVWEYWNIDRMRSRLALAASAAMLVCAFYIGGIWP